MISILSKIFIKDRENTDDPNVRKSYGVLCGLLGIILNAFLFAGKLFAGIITSSIAITADAFNNLSDAGSSLITLLGFKIASQKPDPEHPFGHGRYEYISGLIVSFAIIMMGFELFKSSVEKIITPEKVEFSVVSLIILVASILVKVYMFIYNRGVAKKINSAAMSATAKDSLSDTVSTFVVLVSMLVSKFANINIDSYCGALVAIFIFWAGISAAKETIDPLLGNVPEKEFVDRIAGIVISHDEVIGIHDLVVHDYGPGRVMISLHAEVSANADMLETHDVIDNIERELKETLGCEAVIHMDPIAADDEVTSNLKNEMYKKVKEIDESLSIHDFRIVAGPTHTNLIFDVVLPYDVKLTDAELRQKVSLKTKELGENYFSVINIDRSFT